MLAETGGIGDIYERALARIAKQSVLTHACDQNVWISVVVVVPDGDSHAVEFHVETGAGRDIGERSIAVVVVEAERRAGLLMSGPI